LIVLITIPWFAPAFRAGGPIQSIVNLVNEFENVFEFKIYCSNKDLNNEVLDVIPNKWIKYNNHAEVFYCSNPTYASLKNCIAEVKPAFIYVNGIFSIPFNFYTLFFYSRAKTIVATRGMLHAGALAQKSFKKNIYLNFLKLLGLRKKVSFHATDEAEKKFIQSKFGINSKVIVANNLARNFYSLKPIPKNVNELKLITIALISPMKNYLLVLKALKAITANISYAIYGPIKDTNYWEQCLGVIKTLPENITVNYFGEIKSENVSQVLDTAHVFIMPSESENFGHAIAEALSASKPVITSHNTPWNNLAINNAGINVDRNKLTITNAIQFYASMSNIDYELHANSAQNFVKNKAQSEIAKSAYKEMFSI
jgi:glycosyltransferase involved in cell wall biosynthesis